MSIVDCALMLFPEKECVFDGTNPTFMSPQCIEYQSSEVGLIEPGSGRVINTSDLDPKDLICNIVLTGIGEIRVSPGYECVGVVNCSLVGNALENAPAETWMKYSTVMISNNLFTAPRFNIIGNAWSMSLPTLRVRRELVYNTTTKTYTPGAERADRFLACQFWSSGLVAGESLSMTFSVYLSLDKTLPIPTSNVPYLPA